MSERFWFWLAWRLPRPLVYFAFIRLWAHATTGQYANRHPDDVRWSEASKAWGEP